MTEQPPSHRLGLFLSWSGTESREVAGVLRSWIPRVVQAVEPWMSDEDLHGRWSLELGRVLESFSFGLVCVTPSNRDAPWVQFETGALSKALNTSEVIPVLHRVGPADLAGNPLSQFQHARTADRARMRWMMGRLNESCGPLAVGDEVLDDAFDRTWDEVSAELGSISGDEDPVTPAIAPEPGAVLNQILDQLAAQGEILERIVRDSRPRPRRYEEASLESRPAPRPVSTDHSWLEIGLGVEHPVFGHGKIVDISGQGDKTEVTIDFVGVGVKHLAATWAPLQPSTSGSEDAAGTDP